MRNPLLQHLHYHGNGISFRFTDQYVDVLRHDDVSDHVEAVASAHLLEDFQKYIACTGTAQERLALIAARGDEV